MNEMRRLIESIEDLDESAYLPPAAQRELTGAVRELLTIMGKYDLEADDVAHFVENGIYQRR